jgi:hypothetical protein
MRPVNRPAVVTEAFPNPRGQLSARLDSRPFRILHGDAQSSSSGILGDMVDRRDAVPRSGSPARRCFTVHASWFMLHGFMPDASPMRPLPQNIPQIVMTRAKRFGPMTRF